MSKHKHQKTRRHHVEPAQNVNQPAQPQPGNPSAASHAPTHAEKLSEAVLVIAQPVLDKVPDAGDKEMVLVVATQVWNIALLPRAEQGKAIHDIVEALGLHEDAPQLLDEFLNDIDTMLDQKRKFFANDRRAILDYNIDRKHGALNLRVLGLDELEAA